MNIMHSPIFQAQVRALLKPFDISTPMARSHYWVFHLLAALVINLSVYVGQIIELAGAYMGLSFANTVNNAFVLAVMLWCFTALLTAMARRMRDRGFSRYSLVALLGLGVCFVVSFLRDVTASYAISQGFSQMTPLPVQWRMETFILFGMMMPALLHVFLGLTGRRREPKEKKGAET